MKDDSSSSKSATDSQAKKQDAGTAPAVVLTSAPPPLHTVVAIGVMSAVFLNYLPSIESLDDVAKVETFTYVIFPDIMDVYSLAYIRLLIALTIWFTSVQTVLSPGWTQTTTYQKGSKLKMTANRLKGIKTMFPFTSWSWNMLGLSFTLNAYIAIQGAASSQPVNPWLLRAAIFAWTIAAPCALLVSAVIRYAIWPIVLASPTGDTTNLKSLRNMMMHNMNSVYAVTELALTGGLPIRLNELSLIPLYGIVYVLFSWSMSMSWNEPSEGPQFIYFFFDTTLPGLAPTRALLALLFALLVIFGVFCACEQLLAWIDGGLLAHLAFCIVVCGSVIRIRD